MKALSYLIIISIKNRILELKKKPAMLVLYIIVGLLIIGGVISSLNLNKNTNPEITNLSYKLNIFYIIVLVCTAFILLFNMFAGLENGATLFDMADVNHVFVAPISPMKILFYGIIKQLGKVFLSSIFIFYQIGNLKGSLDFGFSEIIFLFILMIIISFISQLLAMSVYIFSNGNESRKQKIKTGLLFIGVIILIYAYIQVKLSEEVFYIAILKMMESRFIQYIPLVGWSLMLMKAVIEGNALLIFISIGLYIIFSILLVIFIAVGDRDYYEDVLVSTEITHDVLKAVKEKDFSRRNPNQQKKIKVKERVMGIHKGQGAWTIFYKQILEMRRLSKIAWLDSFTIILAIIITGLSYYIDFEYLSYIILGTLLYIQFIFSMIAGINLEISSHYIFLIPDKSYKKIIAIILKPIVKAFLDGLIFFAILVIMGRENIITAILLLLAYSVSVGLFQALFILYQRLLKGQPNIIVRILISIIIIVTVFIPILIGTIILVFVLPKNLMFLSLLPFILVSLLVIVIIISTCRNLFDKTEYSR